MDSENLKSLRDKGWESLYPSQAIRITVGMASCGIASGAQVIFDKLLELAAQHPFPISVESVGCMGMCWKEPLVEISIPGQPRATYQNVTEAVCVQLMHDLEEKRYSDKNRFAFTYRDWSEGWNSWIDLAPENENSIENDPFISKQTKRITSAWGKIVPWSVEQYAAVGGYEALAKAVSMEPDAIISIVEASGLRGRGGAGFPTGEKWRLTAHAAGEKHFLIANADEGDPGAYMDRGLMESDPHRLIEGMALAALAIQADHGYIFTRSEYPQAIETMEKALEEAHRTKILPLSSLPHFDLTIIKSAGAYVCGEESALISVLEGNRPDPRKKPPYPSERGLGDFPTCINNVETYANIPSIILHGAERFRSCGTSRSPGTKLFSLAGSIKHPGLIEIAFGMPLADMVNEIALPNLQSLRNIVYEKDTAISIQIGGPSGTILPLNVPGITLDFEGLADAGSIIGSGGIVVLGQLSCIVDTVHYFLSFSAHESCGQCKSCREGLCEATGLVDAIRKGQGHHSMIERLLALCESIPRGSKCALGTMSINPLKSGLHYFMEDFEEHLNGTCSGLTCKDLMHFEVIEKACPGCLCCLPSCPTGAIKGRYGKPFHIDQTKCTKCWMCVSQCPYPALKAFPHRLISDKEDGTAASDNPEASTLHSSPQEPLPAEHENASPEEDFLENCILCGKCVEVCRKRGTQALFFSGTGIDRKLIKPIFEGKTDCIDCGACNKICPTHAINAIKYTPMNT